MLDKTVTLGLLVAGALAGTLSIAGCGGGSNPPIIDDSSLVVVCSPVGEDYEWVFEALVDDPDGYEDVAAVYVNVYEAGGEDALERLDLEYESNGKWSLNVLESATISLDCEQKEGLEFDFWAEDVAGDTDSVTTLAQ